MKLQELLRHVADNVENGLDEGADLFYKGRKFQGGMPDFSQYEHFSLAPRTHVVNGFTVPAPEEEKPSEFTEFWIPNLLDLKMYSNGHSRFQEQQEMWMERGLVHLTKEAAIANAKAMLGINPKWSDEK